MATDLELLQRLTTGVPRSAPFRRVPDGWGIPGWLRARDEAATRPVVLGIIGDSIGKGTDASNQFHTSWPGLLRRALQQKFGDGGSGFVTVDQAQGGVVGSTGAWTTAPAFGQPSRGGPGGVSYRPTVAGNGATLTFPVWGSTVTLWAKTAPSFGRVDVAIDGGAPVQVPLTAAVSVTGRAFTGLTAGPHSVVVTAASGSSEVYGVSARNATGVVVDNYSGGGNSIAGSAFSLATVTVSGTGTYTTDTLAAMGTCDALIIALGVNDTLAALSTGEALSDNLNGVIARAWDQGATDSTPPDIVVVVQHAGKVDTFLDTALEYPQVAQQLRSIADGYGAALVDVWAAGGRSWKRWADANYWGSSNTDTVHPNDAGHRAYFDLISPLFLW